MLTYLIVMQFKDSIGYLLHELAHHINAESNQVLMERLGIGFGQFKVLMVLEDSDGLTQKQIAVALRQTEASISRQIKLLKQKNLAEVRISSSNRREHTIFITDRGFQMVDRGTNALNTYHSPLFEHLTEKEQIKITNSLRLIRKSLDN